MVLPWVTSIRLTDATVLACLLRGTQQGLAHPSTIFSLEQFLFSRKLQFQALIHILRHRLRHRHHRSVHTDTHYSGAIHSPLAYSVVGINQQL